jgi:3-dehydroquinate synthase
MTNPQASTDSKPIAVRVSVPQRDRSYDLLIGRGVLQRIGNEIKRHLPSASRVLVVSDDNVAPLYLEGVREQLEAGGLEVFEAVLPAGEASKSVDTLVEVVGFAVEKGLSRDDLVVSLGGGVVGDLGGLVAALFMRGIAFVQVPTSLLAQVDASVGGKVAVDLPAGKNLFGAFHFPAFVAIDPDVLRSLPDRDLGCGLAEMFKHAALFSEEHFEELEQLTPLMRGRDAATLSRMVAISAAHKSRCVSRDPRESEEELGGRVLLNLGHTVGHGLEQGSNFELQHGEAVALGLVAAARISAHKCGADEQLEARFVRALSAAGLPIELDEWCRRIGYKSLEQLIARDKKRRAGEEITFVGLAQLGRPRLLRLRSSEIVHLLQLSRSRA